MQAMTMPSTDGRTQHAARLLVVEDEPNILELLSASLRYAGFEVLTATGGQRRRCRPRSGTGPISSCST